MDDNAREAEAPPARPLERFTSEAIGWWTSATAAAYASFQEFLPPLGKAVVGTVLASAAATGAYKAWRGKINEQKEDHAD